MKIREKGFSLLELILAALIVGIVAGFGLYSLAQGRQSAESRGLAEEIAEEFKAARQQAISHQVPVALVFPSSGGATGKSQSFYQLEGLAAPRVSRSMDYSETYPESCFFWGIWAGGNVSAIVANMNTDGFRLADWSPLPRADDYHLIFMPSGGVTSNGLPLFGGEYRMLVSNGLGEGGGGVGSLRLKSPTAGYKSHTITISQTGTVSIVTGVKGLALIEDPTVTVGSVTPSLRPAPPSNIQPKILSLVPEPKPLEVSKQGAVAIVPREGYISLLTRADNSSGGQLSVWWEAKGAGGGGKFSSDKPTAMTWNPTEKVWSSRWNWTPPKGAAKGEAYRLTCYVKDSQGHVASQDLGAGTTSVEILSQQKVACINADYWEERFQIASFNPEGTNIVTVTPPDVVDEELTPVWSPNGDRIVFYSGWWVNPDDFDDDRYKATLNIVNDDGSDLRQLFSSQGDIQDYAYGASFSPDGTRVAFSAYKDDDDDWLGRVWVCDTYGSPSKKMLTAPTDPYDYYDVTWHPSKNIILCSAYHKDSTKSVVRLVNYPSGSIRDVVTDSGGDGIGETHWSSDGSKIVYTKDSKLFVISVDENGNPTGPSRSIITPTGVDPSYPRFSNGDNHVAFSDWNNYDLYVVGLGVGSVPKQLTNTRDVNTYNWSPDGQELIYTNDEGQIFLIDADGGSPSKEVTPKDVLTYTTPSWWASGH